MTFPLRSARGAVPASVFAFALLLALVSGFTAGCDPNAATTLLVPTGSEDGCFSDVMSIRMVGDFTTPVWTIPSSPAMTLARVDGECVWQVTVRLNQGPVLFKFVTDDAFDSPTDYGGNEKVTLDIPGGPHPTSQTKGTGTAIKVNVAATGDYSITLNEADETWTAVAVGPTPEGGISGTVSFSGLTTAPFPAATVEVYAGTTRVASTMSDPTTRAFTISGLDPGPYRVVASANCFATVEQNDVMVTTGVTNVGDLVLTAVASAFSTIQMVGDFTAPPFNIPISPQMTPGPGACSWTVTVTLPAGTVYFKFVTNGAFDSPPDYGGSETVTLEVPGGPHPTQLVTGTGTAIKINVAEAGSYTFTLNEVSLTWSAVAAGPPPGGGIAGSVAFEGLSSAPYPTARIEAYAGTTLAGSTTTDPTTRAFSLEGLTAGTYRLVAAASCFATVELGNVVVSSGPVDVGELAMVGSGSAFTTIDLVGGFNLFTPGADPMVQASNCLWTRDRFISAGVYQIKFLTDGVYDTPPDYGWDDTITYDVPGSGSVRPVSGPGTNIRISVANSGTYRFILDEKLQRWEVQLVTPAPEVVR